MPVKAGLLGTEFEPFVAKVSARAGLAYAAAIGCRDERYLDDARRGGLEVPGPFCVSLEWKITGDPAVKSMLGLSAEEAGRAVHAGQATRFFRTLRAGEKVRVSGQITGVRSTRAGALVSTTLRTTGADASDVITESVSDAIYRGVACESGPADPAILPVTGADAPAAYLNETAIALDRMFPHIYTECASIWNPIHTERRVALARGLPDIIVHGTALWALAWRQLSEAFGNVERLEGRFSAMVIAGTGVVLKRSEIIPGSRTVRFRLDNDAGAPAISDGFAQLARPRQ